MRRVRVCLACEQQGRGGAGGLPVFAVPAPTVATSSGTVKSRACIARVQGHLQVEATTVTRHRPTATSSTKRVIVQFQKDPRDGFF